MYFGQKTFILFVLLISTILTNSLSVYSQTGGPLVETISLSGIVKTDIGSYSDIQITLFQNGKKIRSVYPNAQGKYELELNFQSDYEIVFASKGNVAKKMLVNTETEGDDDEYDIPTLNFNIQLPKASGGPIDEAYNTPVSRLFIDEELGNFNRDSKVESAFKNELKRKTDEHKKWEAEQKLLLAQQKAEEEERKKAEEEARRKAMEEARLAELNKAKQEAAEKARLEQEAQEKKRLEEEQRKQAQKDAINKENELLRKQEEQRKLEEIARKKAEEEKHLQEMEAARLKQQELDAQKQAQADKIKAEQDALTKSNLQKEQEEQKRKQAELDEFNRLKTEADKKRLEEEQEKARLAEEASRNNTSLIQKRDYEKQQAFSNNLKESHRRQEISKEAYLERQRERQRLVKLSDNFVKTNSINKKKGEIADKKIKEQQEKSNLDTQKAIEEDSKRQTIIARQLKIQAEDSHLGNARTKELDTKRQTKVQKEIEERMAQREAYLKERREKDVAKELERAALLKEAMQKGNVPVLTPFIYDDGKYVGTVNYNDGRGNIPVTEAEFKQIQDQLKKP